MAEISERMRNKKLKLSSKHRKDTCIDLPRSDDTSISAIQSSQALESKNDGIKDSLLAKETQNAVPPNITSLYNIGNTCYLISLIYALRFLDAFRTYLHRLACEINHDEIRCKVAQDLVEDNDTEVNVCLQLHELYRIMRKMEVDCEQEMSSETSISPDKLQETLRKLYREYEGNCQHDVHELMGHLLDCIEKLQQTTASNKKLNKKTSESICVFHGRMCMRTVCLECEGVAEKEDTFWDIGVPLLQKNDSLIGVLTNSEILRDENKVFCENCCHLNEVIRSTRFLLLPKILVLRCKATTQTPPCKSDCDLYKSQWQIDVPLEVPCLLDCASSTNEPCIVHSYRLSSVVCHVGATHSSGHYTAYVRSEPRPTPPAPSKTEKRQNKRKRKPLLTDDCCGPIGKHVGLHSNRWLYFDDHKVTIVDDGLPVFDSKQSTATPYLLFYCRNDGT